MNADPRAAFTSEYVCNNLARKTVQSVGETSARQNAARFNENLLLPVAKRLIMSQKMPRGDLGRMAKNLCNKLRQDTAIIDVEYDSFSKKLSPKEQHRLSYLLAVSEDPNWLDFVATEIRMERRSITTNVCVVDLRIHRHALSRYMQRELRPAETMLGDLAETLHASSMLGVAAAAVEGGNIAIPLKTGLLLGRVSVLSEEGTRMVLMMDKDGPRQAELERGSIAKDVRIHVELMTYVDGVSLGPVKQRVYDAVSDFIAQNRTGMKALFDASYYTCSVIGSMKHDDYFDQIGTAINAAVELVQTSDWQNWVNNVGAGR